MERPNYLTPGGYRALRAEYEQLFAVERPALVETISWAAGNGDRSENGDYIYGRKRLREIDRRLGWLSRRMKAAKVIDPARQQDRSRVWFGATVTIVGDDDAERVVTLVGDDEADAGTGRIGWSSPVARALRGAAVGDGRTVALPGGEKSYEVLAVRYPEGRDGTGRRRVGCSRQRRPDMAENERTTQARDHDDSALIDDAADLPTPAHSNASGGHLATDVASRNELEQVGDPEHLTRATKQADIDNDQAAPADRRGGA